MRPTRFEDAVKILGAGDSRIAAVLDRLASGVIIGAALFTGGASLALLEAKNQMVKYSHELVGRVTQKRVGAKDRSPTELLIAAHTVIVVAAFIEALDGLLASSSKDQRGRKSHQLTRTDLASLESLLTTDDANETMGTEDTSDRRFTFMLKQNLPYPDSIRPFSGLVGELREIYTSFSDEARQFLTATEYWDRISASDRRVVKNALNGLADRAISRYRELYCQLAARCPIFFLWGSLQYDQALDAVIAKQAADIRERFGELKTAIAGLESGLSGFERLLTLAGAGNGEYAHSAAAIRARAELDWPIVDAGPLDANKLLQFPLLADGYVNPSGRVTAAGPGSRPADDRWWEAAGVVESKASELTDARTTATVQYREDIQVTIASLLVSPHSTETPTIVLGQPGAGKSVLTRVLAARLAEAGFLALRVELRRVEPDAPIQGQVEESIYLSTGERTTWPEVVRAAPEAPRVILLDGFDELLQATGASQSDYLEKVHEFQLRERELGRAVAVVVTSRTIVADRVRYPQHCSIIRLEPFTSDQVFRWVSIWNETNRSFYSRRGRTFSADGVMRYDDDLVSQPLLLLMLALYDADAGDLDGVMASIARGQLYEQILLRFVRREVTKNQPRRDRSQTQLAIERELTQLAVAAFSMFNRNRQSVAEQDLDADMRALKVADPTVARPGRGGFTGPLSPARRLLSRFFFIYDSSAKIEGARVSAYEFLHATFGEYLVARLTVRTVSELARSETGPAQAIPTSDLDDGLVFGLLSFAPLSSRSAIIEFLREQVGAMAQRRRDGVQRLLIYLLGRSFFSIPTRSFSGYEPALLPIVGRQAIYAANLVLMILALQDHPIEVSTLFRGASDPLDTFRRMAYLWKSQLSPEAWRSFVEALWLERRQEAHGEEITLSFVPAEGSDRRSRLDDFQHLAIPESVVSILQDAWMFGEPGAADLLTWLRSLP